MSLTDALRIRRTDSRSIGSVALAMRRAFPFHQFGQANDSRSNDGATGCTDTCLQFLALLVKGTWYTHDRIRAMVGNRNPLGGLTYGQVSAWLTAARLPYRVDTRLTFEQIASLVRTRGPVMIGEMYGQHPSWQGYAYGGRRASAAPNGFARPLGKAGRTQLGPTFRHAVLILCLATRDGIAGAYILEPNHNSAVRPEDPPYDFISLAQLRRLVVTYRSATGTTYAAYATRPVQIAA